MFLEHADINSVISINIGMNNSLEVFDLQPNIFF